MNSLKLGDEFTWNGIECIIVHHSYEFSVLCMRKGTSIGKFGVPIREIPCSMCRGAGFLAATPDCDAADADCPKCNGAGLADQPVNFTAHHI